MLVRCAWCQTITGNKPPYDGDHAEEITDGICPACLEKHFPGISKEVLQTFDLEVKKPVSPGGYPGGRGKCPLKLRPADCPGCGFNYDDDCNYEPALPEIEPDPPGTYTGERGRGAGGLAPISESLKRIRGG